jgi:hypothetical protein
MHSQACIPLDFGAYDVDDLFGQTGNVLVAQVDCDAGLLLLQLARCLGSGAMYIG